MENHGFFINNSERLRHLVYAVDRPNFRMLLDVGNFLCLDEDPLAAVPRSLPMAAVVHLKDFLVRDDRPGDGWLTTAAGRSILGTIVGHGDLPVRALVGLIAASGFDGPVSIEFEGLEDPAWPSPPAWQRPPVLGGSNRMSTIGIGVVGAGNIAEFHLAAYAANPDVEIVAVADIAVDRARARADQFGASSAYASVEELLADPAVDAVSICTRNDTHSGDRHRRARGGQERAGREADGADGGPTRKPSSRPRPSRPASSRSGTSAGGRRTPPS